MTRRILKLSIALAAGITFGLLMARDPGYLLISYGSRTLESSLWGAMLIAGLIALGMWLAYRAVRIALGAGSFVKNILTDQRDADTTHYIHQGLMYESEGKHGKALAAYMSALAHRKTSVDVYIRAASAAQNSGNLVQRDRVLDEAASEHPKQAVQVGLKRAELLWDSGETVAARATVQTLAQDHPRTEGVLRLQARLNFHQENWPDAIEALQALLKKKPADGETLRAQLKKAFASQLRDLVRPGTKPAQLQTAWKEIPRGMRDDLELVESYCRSLAAMGQPSLAADVLIDRLRHGYRESLALFLGTLDIAPQVRIKALTDLIEKHPNSAAAHLALARSLVLVRNTTGARQALQRSINLGTTPQALEVLAQVETQEQHHEQAAKLLRRARQLEQSGGAAGLLPEPQQLEEPPAA